MAQTLETLPESAFKKIDLGDIVVSIQEAYKKHQEFYARDKWQIVYFCCYQAYRSVYPQPRNLDELDQEFIKEMRRQKFSIGDIAWAVQRSKSTVYDHCVKELHEKGITDIM